MKLSSILLCCVLTVQNGVIGKLQKGSQVETLTRTEIPNLATTKFSANLYEAVKGSESLNFVLSPLSLRNALATLSLGAAGGTFDEIRQALQFPDDTNHLMYNQSQLMQSLKKISLENSGVEFVAADKVFVNSGLRVKNVYRNHVSQLDGEIENVDFGQSEAAAKKINAWVQHKTAGKIEKIVDSVVLKDETSLLVLNTSYFKGQWKNQFPPEDTKKRSFFIRENKNVEVDTMVQENHFVFAYLQEANAQVINLPYQGDRLSMMIYLPNQQSSLDNFEDWLKNQSPFEIQKQHMQESQNQSIKIFLPKFKIRSSLQLNEPLKSLGLRKMFEPNEANFSNIFRNTRTSFVSKVSQETFIEVNEEGTEAAAVTGLELGEVSFGPQFIVNRPFLFQILDQTTQTVLFTGRVKDPRAESANSPVSAKETEETGNSTATFLVEDMITSPGTNSNVSAGSGRESTSVRIEKSRNEQLFKELFQFMKHMNGSFENLKSRVGQLEIERAGAAGRKFEGTTLTSTTPTPTFREEDDAFIPTPTAWGYAEKDADIFRWRYNPNVQIPCANLHGFVDSVFLKGSCVMLYRNKNCSGDKFQLDTTNSHLGWNIRKQFPIIFYPGFYQSPKSIGRCV